MKLDAMDKFDLRSEKNEKSTILFLFFVILFMLVIFAFILFLNSTKISDINLTIIGLKGEYQDEFLNFIKDKKILQILLPNFKKKLSEIYFIKSVKIFYLPLKKVKIQILEKKPFFILYDRKNGIFYQMSEDKKVLRIINDNSLLSYSIISLELNKKYERGEKIEFFYNRIEFYNEDYQLSEIIVDKGNIFGIPVKYKYLIQFGSYVDRNKIDNLNLLFTFIKENDEDKRIKNITFIDFTYSDIARLIFRQE